MAGFLPLVASLLVGGGVLAAWGRCLIAAVAAAATLVGAIRFGESLGRIVSHHSEEVVLLSALGLVLLVAGAAERLQVSAAVGAFLVGIALSGEVAHRTRDLLTPIRDVNAALFFLFFGLQLDTSALPAVALPVLALVVVSARDQGGRRLARRAARRRGPRGPRARRGRADRARRDVDRPGHARRRAASELAPLAAGYVLMLAIAGPVLMRYPACVDTLARRLTRPRCAGEGDLMPMRHVVGEVPQGGSAPARTASAAAVGEETR